LTVASNPLPWVILAGAVLVVLYLKGYVKLPWTGAITNVGAPPTQATGTNYPSAYDLGVAYVVAKRREAEHKVVAQMVADINQSIEEKYGDLFTAPVNLTGPKDQASQKDAL
jgi:hypothetical protein